MAKAAKSDSDKKKKKAAAAVPATIKIKVKKDKSGKKSDKKTSKAREGFESLSKLADHPLLADLLAAGAIAAVAAIAEHQLASGKGRSSSTMVKTAGKAAAAAMGRKLMGDIGAVTTAATDAAKKA